MRKGRISILVGNPDFFRYSGRSLLKASPRPAAALSCVHLPPTSGLPFLSSSGSPEGSWQSKLATPGPSRPLHTTGLHPPQGLASLSADGPRLAPALLPHLCSSVTFSMTLWSLRLTNNPSPAFVSLTLLFFFFLKLILYNIYLCLCYLSLKAGTLSGSLLGGPKALISLFCSSPTWGHLSLSTSKLPLFKEVTNHLCEVLSDSPGGQCLSSWGPLTPPDHVSSDHLGLETGDS